MDGLPISAATRPRPKPELAAPTPFARRGGGMSP